MAPPRAAAADPIVVTKIAPWSSGNSAIAADGFEVINTGATAVNIGGSTIDDDSDVFAASVAL